MSINDIIEIGGGITSPRGFQAVGVHCGIKKVKKDFALVYTAAPAACAASFTTNVVQAAPVCVDKELVARGGRFKALAVNSGNANACTGERGLHDAWEMVRMTADALHVQQDEVLVSSTGVIGQYLCMQKIGAGITLAAGSLGTDGTSAAEAIRTTDTFTKEAAVQFMHNGVCMTLGGMAKGSGMIAPNMATMLAFVSTDANIGTAALQQATSHAVVRSFNRISVDGDMSTNDMVIVLANGLAGNPAITEPAGDLYTLFAAALEQLLVKLSKMIVMDGEGATKFVEIRVVGAASETEADRAARAVANSNLVKTAINGEDANWGRILAAIGYSGITFDPALVTIHFGDVPILGQNYAIDFSEERAKQVLSQREIVLTIDLHRGSAAVTFWTCDLSKDYVAINANYRT
jgi:glutamate N-acetyltransferase / amino-acid N-acetyltransferase